MRFFRASSLSVFLFWKKHSFIGITWIVIVAAEKCKGAASIIAKEAIGLQNGKYHDQY